MSSRDERLVTVFAGGRDYFQAAIALEERRLLECLVTDVFLPGDNGLARLVLSLFLTAEQINSRFSAAIPRDRVRLSMMAGLMSAARAASGLDKFNRLKDKTLGRVAAEEATRRASRGVFAYSYYASSAFARMNKDQKRFLFQVHPEPTVVRRIFEREIEHRPESRASLSREYEMGDQRLLESLSDEPRHADHIFCASSFTARTLQEAGVAANKITVVPYGVDEVFSTSTEARPFDHALRLIFVGSATHRKGIMYLRDAMLQLEDLPVELLVCTRTRTLPEFAGVANVRIMEAPSRQELVKLLQSSDLFILPSFVEGFGHVVLEAMAAGVCPVTTANTCGPDVFTAKEGFIVPTGDADAIVNVVKLALADRGLIREMGARAAERARIFTWSMFRDRLADAVERELRRA